MKTAGSISPRWALASARAKGLIVLIGRGVAAENDFWRGPGARLSSPGQFDRFSRLRPGKDRGAAGFQNEQPALVATGRDPIGFGEAVPLENPRVGPRRCRCERRNASAHGIGAVLLVRFLQKRVRCLKGNGLLPFRDVICCRAKMSAAVKQFRAGYGVEPTIRIEAPGRVNWIGEHIDYLDGWVMPAAIEPRITLLAAHDPSARVGEEAAPALLKHLKMECRQALGLDLNCVVTRAAASPREETTLPELRGRDTVTSSRWQPREEEPLDLAEDPSCCDRNPISPRPGPRLSPHLRGEPAMFPGLTSPKFETALPDGTRWPPHEWKLPEQGGDPVSASTSPIPFR